MNPRLGNQYALRYYRNAVAAAASEMSVCGAALSKVTFRLIRAAWQAE
jgi:hypothetical protein